MGFSDAQQAYVLHLRNYTDSKKLVSLFSYETGVLNCVARPSKRWPALQAFQPMLVHVSGKSGLKNLRSVESGPTAAPLSGQSLYCAFYLNELLLRALAQEQAQPLLYRAYEESLQKLSEVQLQPQLQQILLRRFEFCLLAELGFALDFERSADGSIIADSRARFRFEPGRGFCPEYNSAPRKDIRYFSAEQLGAIAEQRWSSESLRAAKALVRLALPQLIGHEPLKARELFR
ncbi:DNA repair protein RecO [Agaribacterium haliotis]|uniref:DNA repair protein RecO n=1 Tax=Agaribacterium haliotis TaxID=2013869 RepID=UPI000BB565B9|nr:DNA repair protein RecO [Agaribacterium haliotis]